MHSKSQMPEIVCSKQKLRNLQSRVNFNTGGENNQVRKVNAIPKGVLVSGRDTWNWNLSKMKMLSYWTLDRGLHKNVRWVSLKL